MCKKVNMIYNEFGKPLFDVVVIKFTHWTEYHVYDVNGFLAVHIIPTT